MLLIAAHLPFKLTFAVNTYMAKKWWIKPFLSLVETFPIDPTNPMSTKSLIKAVKENKKLVIFPEGRVTVTGSLMKIYEGPGLIADQADAQILPIRAPLPNAYQRLAHGFGRLARCVYDPRWGKARPARACVWIKQRCFSEK